MTKCKTRAIIFDLDDTIGHFEQFSIFKYGIDEALQTKVGKNFYMRLLDLYPKIFRPGIFQVLNYLKLIKKRDKWLKVIIYTNNNGPRSWTLLIKNYLESKINFNIFDKVITKYDTSSIINCRTTYKKTYDDLIKCANLPENTKILFLDDQIHHLMKHDNINYLKLSGYNFHIVPLKMTKVFLNSALGKIVPEKEHDEFKVHILQVMSSENNFKISKTVIIPLGRQGIFTAKARISEVLPNWTGVLVENRGKYLGYMIGPGAASSSWNAPAAKWEERVKLIKSTRGGLRFTTMMYNTTAITTLAFIAQLEPVIQNLSKKGKILVELVGWLRAR